MTVAVDDTIPEVFFPNLRMRAVLLKHVGSLGVASEIEGVPSEFAASLVNGKLLHPKKLVSNIFIPLLNWFAEQAYKSMVGMSDGELASSALVVNPVYDPNMSMLDSFHSYGLAGRNFFTLIPTYTKQEFLLKKLLDEVEPEEINYNSFVDEMKVKTSSAVQKFSRGPFAFSSDYYASTLLAVKAELIQSLVYASIYDGEMSRSGRDAVEDFDEHLGFHCERLKSFVDTPWGLSFELT